MFRIAYLISRYPALSHTFILREVLELRRCGGQIHTASVNPPDRPLAALDPEERAEAENTFVLKQQGFASIGRAIFSSVRNNPAGLWRGLCLAVRLGGSDLKAIKKRLFYFAEAILVGEWMRGLALEHLHVHFATPASTVALLAKEIFGIRFSMTVHGPDEFYSVDEYHLAAKIEAASFLCTIGNYCRSQLMKLSAPEHWSKMAVAPLGVDPGKFQPCLARTGNDPLEVLCVGRLVPAKGQAILIEAVARLRADGLPVHLTLAGDGPDRIRLEGVAKRLGITEHCSFLGAVNPEHVRSLYERATLFVLPSFAEGIPVVLMEAMAMEVACISTIVNGIPELIESGTQGVLVSPSDVAALAVAMRQLLEQPVLRSRLAAEGRRKVVSHFNLQPNVARLGRIFTAEFEGAA